MIASHEQQMAHARAVRARGNAMPPDGLPPGNILDSWVRCMHAGLDASATPNVPVVAGSDLLQRRERSQFVRRLAQAQLETLSQQIAGSNFLLAFADVDGVILDLYADNRFSMSGSDAGIVAGSCWGEVICGTNGLGTVNLVDTATAAEAALLASQADSFVLFSLNFTGAGVGSSAIGLTANILGGHSEPDPLFGDMFPVQLQADVSG